MDASGEVADLMVKESIQLTEASIKMLAAGCKNLTAFLYALHFFLHFFPEVHHR